MEAFQCWVDEDGKIVSFRPMTDAQYEEFQSQEELMKYIFDIIDRLHYRVQ